MSLPPAPRSTALAQTLQWQLRPYLYLRECRDELGDVFTLNLLGWGRRVIVGSAAGVKEMFAADGMRLRTGAANAYMLPVLGDRAMLLNDGPDHLRYRRVMQPGFHARAVYGYGGAIRASAERAVTGVPLGRTFRMHDDVIMPLALDVALKVVLGARDPQRVAAFTRSMKRLLGTRSNLILFVRPLQRDLGPGSPGRWHRREVEALDRLIYPEIARRRAEVDAREPEDLLDWLVRTRDEDGELVSDREVRDQVVNLIVAGHHTTATGLAWALYFIHHVPGVLERLRAELAALPKEPSAQEVYELRYLDAVCREALRVEPVIGVVSRRVGGGPLDFRGYRIPEGEMMSASVYLVHHDAALYAEPERFRPERFLERRFGPHEFIPFGGGPHLCIGLMLGLLEMKLVLETFLRALDLELVSAPLRGVRSNVTVAPARGTPMRARRRI